MRKVFIIACLALSLTGPVKVNAAPAPFYADERIKTFVFDSNEIYRIPSRSGFQTTIEFNADESIDTISIGDSIGWQLTPAGKRLFIKPLHNNGITNLSVITNRRTYQFELVSATSSDKTTSSHVYVVRFYYPDPNAVFAPMDDRTRGSLRPISPTMIPEFPQSQMPMQQPFIMQQPQPRMYNPLPGSYR